jgi:two-component system, NtrC family, response regulator AtoC
MLSLTVVGRMSIFSAPLPPDCPMTLGRGDDSDIQIDDGRVSRTHARVVHRGSRVEIVDVGSANGTFLGPLRLVPGEAMPLAIGDAVTVGATMILVEEAAEPVRAIWSEDELAKRFDELRRRAEETGRAFALAYVDVEGGELCAAETTRRASSDLLRTRRLHGVLSRALQSTDIVSGHSRGAYLMLLDDVTPALGDDRMSSLAAELAAHGFVARLGVASFPRDGDTRAELSRLAQMRASGARPYALAREGALARMAPVVERLARGNVTILVCGETGVGKEVLVRSIHERSSRASGPFLGLNCGGLSETLLEAELFGFERGAFTGATRAKPGLLETAEGGTIFLDEVGEMPPSLQVKLLRVIEQRELTRVGGLTPTKIDVRFIAATHRDLQESVALGTFRQDLFYRLNGVVLHVPPLRERLDEIEPLAREFARLATPPGLPAPDVSEPVLDLLRQHKWPGNIRELRNVIERAVLLCTGDAITLEHVPREMMTTLLPEGARPLRGAVLTTRPPPPGFGADIDPSGERSRIVGALEACAGNQTKAARILGVSRRTLVSLLDRFELPRPRKRAQSIVP